jgi:hypothetical protein
LGYSILTRIVTRSSDANVQESLYARFAYTLVNTYPSTRAPAPPATNLLVHLRHGLRIMTNLLLRVGLLSDYRRASSNYFCTRGCFGPTESVLLLVATIDCGPAPAMS